jgi:hypothetical protein
MNLARIHPEPGQDQSPNIFDQLAEEDKAIVSEELRKLQEKRARKAVRDMTDLPRLSRCEYRQAFAKYSTEMLGNFLSVRDHKGFDVALLEFSQRRAGINVMKAQLYLGSKEEIRRLQFVTINSLRELPKGMGVYIVMDEKDVILYVGATWKQGLFLRWANGHHRIPDIQSHGVACRIYYQEFDEKVTQDHVQKVEELMQEIHRPLWNDTPVTRGTSPRFAVVSSEEQLGEQSGLDTAAAIVSEYFRPEFCQSLAPQDIHKLALEIGLRLVRLKNC